MLSSNPVLEELFEIKVSAIKGAKNTLELAESFGNAKGFLDALEVTSVIRWAEYESLSLKLVTTKTENPYFKFGGV